MDPAVPARLADFTAKMRAAGATIPGPDTPTDVQREVPAPAVQPEPAPEKPVETAAPVDAAAAKVPPPDAVFTIDRAKLKRQIKWLDEVEDVDLAHLLETAPEKIDEAFRLAKDRNRQEAKRRDAEEALEKKIPETVSVRDRQWHEALRASGYRLDPTTNRIVALQQAAPPDGSGQPDLDALEKKAVETNEATDWLAYDKALRTSLKQQGSAADVKRMIDERFEAGRRKSEEDGARRASVESFGKKLAATYEARKADFDAAGDDAAYYRQVAAERADLHSRTQGATEESTLKVIHETADRVRKLVSSAQKGLATSAAPAARAKAPTVIPSGGAPAPTKTDPTQFDLKTKDGKAAAAAYLTRLREQQTGRPFQVVS